MGELHFVICRDCQHTGWLANYELMSLIIEHSGHKLAIFPRGAFEDEEMFEKYFRHFMGWPVKEEKEEK